MAKHNVNEIIEIYKDLCHQLGRVANGLDINNCKDLPSSSTIINLFGSIKTLQEKSGMTINGELSGKLLKAELEKRLIAKRVEKGKRLDVIEINNDRDLPRTQYIKRLYNNKSLSAIWEEIEKKIKPGIADYLGIK